MHDMIFEDLASLYPRLMKVRACVCVSGWGGGGGCVGGWGCDGGDEGAWCKPLLSPPPSSSASSPPLTAIIIIIIIITHHPSHITHHVTSQDVRIRVVDLMDHVLSTYDRKVRFWVGGWVCVWGGG